jgi:hypothetical protein
MSGNSERIQPNTPNFIQKPFSPEELVHKVQSMLAG